MADKINSSIYPLCVRAVIFSASSSGCSENQPNKAQQQQQLRRVINRDTQTLLFDDNEMRETAACGD